MMAILLLSCYQMLLTKKMKRVYYDQTACKERFRKPNHTDAEDVKTTVFVEEEALDKILIPWKFEESFYICGVNMIH